MRVRVAFLRTVIPRVPECKRFLSYWIDLPAKSLPVLSSSECCLHCSYISKYKIEIGLLSHLASGSGHRAVRTSATEERVPDSGVTGASVSAASPRTEARMFPSPTSSNQPSQLTRSSSSSAQMRSVSDVIQSSSASPIAGTAGINISPDATNFGEPSTDPSLMDFHSSSESASTGERITPPAC